MLIEARLHQNHCQTSATGRWFFKLHQRKKFQHPGRSLLEETEAYSCHCLVLGELKSDVKAMYWTQECLFNLLFLLRFFHYESLHSRHCILLIITTRFCFMSCYNKKMVFFAPYLLELVCDSRRSVANHSAAPTSAQRPKQPWKQKNEPRPYSWQFDSNIKHTTNNYGDGGFPSASSTPSFSPQSPTAYLRGCLCAVNWPEEQ